MREVIIESKILNLNTVLLGTGNGWVVGRGGKILLEHKDSSAG
jgi:hypothetical protein